MTKKCTFLYDKSPSFHDIASIPDFIEKPQIALLGSFPNDPKIWLLSVNDPKNWGLWNTRGIDDLGVPLFLETPISVYTNTP